MADINQDLLLAVLAVITDAVPRGHALSTALASWADDPELFSGREFLKERGISTKNGSRPSSAWSPRISRDITATSGRAWMPGMPRGYPGHVDRDGEPPLPGKRPGRDDGPSLAATLADGRGGVAAGSSCGPSFPASRATSGSS